MYLVLFPHEGGVHTSVYCDDMRVVARIMDECDGVVVYKLDSLTRVKDMQISCEEILEETE